jgi:hypothetical protein
MTSTETVGPRELRRRLRRQIELRGLVQVSRDLGIARESLARYLARIPVQAGTRALIEAKLTDRGA